MPLNRDFFNNAFSGISRPFRNISLPVRCSDGLTTSRVTIRRKLQNFRYWLLGRFNSEPEFQVEVHGGTVVENETQGENVPVYLDPSNQTATFHSKNVTLPKDIHQNQMVYDEANVQPSSSLLNNDNLPESRTDDEGVFKVDTVEEENGGNYADPWDKKSDKLCESDMAKKRDILRSKLRTIHIAKSHTKQEHAYEETNIDVKKYLYDDPSLLQGQKRKTEPWKNYEYRTSIPKQNFALSSGRGLSSVERNKKVSECIRKDFEESAADDEEERSNLQPGSSNVEEIMYETPNVNKDGIKNDNIQSGNKKLSKRKKIMRTLSGASLRTKLLKFPRKKQKNRRNSSVETDQHVYATPNAVAVVKPFERNAKSLLLQSDAGQNPTQSKSKKAFNYELAKPITESGQTKFKISAYDVSSTSKSARKSSVYTLAKPLSQLEDKDVEQINETTIYFEPMG